MHFQKYKFKRSPVLEEAIQPEKQHGSTGIPIPPDPPGAR
jgi:hypothetical protein